MAKKEDNQSEKLAIYFCPACKQEIQGKTCPYCGDATNTMKLAPDGIDQQTHRAAGLTMTPGSIRPTDIILDTDTMVAQKEAQAQYEEIANNLRESSIIRTQIKKKELEIEKMKKEADLKAQQAAIASGQGNLQSGARPVNGFGQPQGPQMDSGYGFPFMGMNPQNAFMSQLMKLDKDKRKEFLDQLSEADPQAIATMQSMLAPVMPVMQNPYMYGGPGGMNGMGGMGGIPPWMWQQQMMQQMQQQQQSQQAQADPLDIATNLVSTIFELMNKAQPKGDDGTKERIAELKEEIKELKRKSEEPANRGSGIDLKPIMDKMSNLEAQVAAGTNRHSVVDTINEFNQLVTGLESAGLVRRPGSEGRSVDDELKVKKFEFDEKTKNRELEIQEKKIEADKGRAEMGKALLGAMFQRSIMKNKEGADVPASPVKKISVAGSRPAEKVVRAPAVPPEIIESYKADAGIVMETRAPVKKEV